MKVYWDHAVEINRKEYAAGEPFEMNDDEALARIDQGGDCLPHDPLEHARLLKKKAAPGAQDEAQDAAGGEESGDAPEGGSVAHSAPESVPDAVPTARVRRR